MITREHVWLGVLSMNGYGDMCVVCEGGGEGRRVKGEGEGEVEGEDK